MSDEICVLNLSKRLRPEDVLAMVDACSRQQAEDVCPTWSVEHRPVNIYTSIEGLPPTTTDIVPIVDEPGDPGVLGLHSRGIAPYGRVFVNPILDNGGVVLFDKNNPQRLSVASVLAHEVSIELPVDPNCTEYGVDAAGNEYDLEPADPVQTNLYVKMAKMPWGNVPVSVSDFVLPNWFQPGSHGPWNFLANDFPLSGPFQVAPGSYVMKNGQAIFGRTAQGVILYPPAWFLAIRPPGSRRRRVR